MDGSSTSGQTRMGDPLVVLGAVGGCGASTLAALLARRRARSGRTVLVDLDPGGAGQEVLLGLEGATGVRWADLDRLDGGLAAADLTGTLPRWEGVEVLSGHRGRAPSAAATVTVLDALAAGDARLVVDLSARALAHAPALRDLAGASTTVLVTVRDVAGVAAALRVRDALGPAGVLVLRDRPGSTVTAAEAAHALRLRVAARLAQCRSVAGSGERGLGPWPGRRLRRAVARVDRAVSP